MRNVSGGRRSHDVPLLSLDMVSLPLLRIYLFSDQIHNRLPACMAVIQNRIYKAMIMMPSQSNL